MGGRFGRGGSFRIMPWKYKRKEHEAFLRYAATVSVLAFVAALMVPVYVLMDPANRIVDSIMRMQERREDRLKRKMRHKRWKKK